MNVISFNNSNENCVVAVSKLLSTLNVNVTITTLKEQLYNHPDYPSLLSISDVLDSYGVDNVAIKSTVYKFSELPVPFIASIKGEFEDKDLFTVIESIGNDTVRHYHPIEHRWKNISKKDFANRWTSGIVLLVDGENGQSEKDYLINLRKENRLNLARYSTWLALPLLAIFACLSTFFNYGSAAFFSIGFTLLTLLGCIAGALLLWYELDEYNPVLQQICSAGKKVNCAAILNSKGSKIAGISWSVIGFSYFAGTLLSLLFMGLLNRPALFILTWLNIFAATYVFYSVYYQWRIAKQWCALCLIVQGILVSQLLTTLAAGWHTTSSINQVFDGGLFIPLLFAYIIPFITLNLLLPAFRSAKETRRSKSELLRLKHNPQIFEALLTRQKSITESTEGLGILLGKHNATNKIIKVCNPYCGPCAQVHTEMEQLLHNNPDLQIQILFTATNNEGDIRAAPVKHLLAIAENNEAIISQALDDWYLADKKDYQAFAGKYPMNDELKQQDAKVEAMKQWCEKTQIEFTPTFFVNGHQLPEIYSVKDLKYFLSV